jgi:hypothetical protein
MKSQADNVLPQPNLASVEADLFGAIFGFHKKVMTLLRQSSLDEEKLGVVADRIKTLLDNAAADVKQSQPLNVAERLEAAYEEAKRLVDELSGSHDGGQKG